MTEGDVSPTEIVELKVPADEAFTPIVRTLAVALASRLDFTVDNIEDLRLAIIEASSMIAELAAANADMECRFELSPQAMTVQLSAAATDPQMPDQQSFDWFALTATTESASGRVTDTGVELSMRFVSSAKASTV